MEGFDKLIQKLKHWRWITVVIVPGPLRGNVNVMDFIGFIEFNRQFGVRKFIIYISDLSEEMKKIIDYYAHRVQILDVLPWKCPFSNQEIRSFLYIINGYNISDISDIFAKICSWMTACTEVARCLTLQCFLILTRHVD